MADPATGEILFDEGHLLTKEDCPPAGRRRRGRGRSSDVDGEPLRVLSNQMCDLSHYVDFDPLAECGIKERVRFDVLQELLGQYSGEELKEQIKLHKDDLVPKHIIIDDILCLHQLHERPGPRHLRARTISTIWATAVCAAWASCCRTSSASASAVWSV